MMNQGIKELVKNCNKEEIKSIIEYLSNLLINNETDSIKSNNDNIHCPYCNSNEHIKYGRVNGIQKYKCSCGRFYLKSSSRLNYHSKITIDKWLSFIDYEISGLTLSEISYYTKLSVTTCFKLRHKLYSACIRYLNDIVRLLGKTELDSSYAKINLKGTKPNNMPRISKKRGKTSEYRGISHHKVCLIVSADEYDNSFIQIAGLGSESIEKYKRYETQFKKSKLIVCDSKPCINQFANYLGLEVDQIKTTPIKDNKTYAPNNIKYHTTKNGNNFQTLNEVAKIIKDITHKYHGVNIRYLNGYLAFKCLIKNLKYRFERGIVPIQLLDILNNYYNYKKYMSLQTLYPIDLKEAYWEYNYGIFKH